MCFDLYWCLPMLQSGWGATGHVNLWIHPQHLQCEFDAAVRLVGVADPSPPTDDLSEYRMYRSLNGDLLTVNYCCNCNLFRGLTGKDFSTGEVAQQNRIPHPDRRGYIYRFDRVCSLWAKKYPEKARSA